MKKDTKSKVIIVGLKNKIKLGVIPARLNSTRLPKKILADINGKPMVIHTAEQVAKSQSLDKVIIAIDHNETYEALKNFDYELMMTSSTHKSGTDRVAEVVKKINDVAIVINVQADEPFINPAIIDKLVETFNDYSVQMSTVISTQLLKKDLNDENIVKVCVDENLFAIDFNRQVTNRLGGLFKHLGIYGFTKDTLLDFISFSQSIREKLRKLEQMRALDNGIKIKTVITDKDCFSINTMSELSHVRARGRS